MKIEVANTSLKYLFLFLGSEMLFLCVLISAIPDFTVKYLSKSSASINTEIASILLVLCL